MDWSLNGGRLVTVGKVGEVKTWNVTHTSKTTIQMTKQSAFKVHTELTCVLFHAAKDDLVFVGTKMREVLVVDVQVGVLLDKFTMNAVPLCMESNTSGCVLFVGDAEGNISVLTCDARMKKTLSLKSEGDAAVENPLQRVINERSASQSERMSVVGHQQLPDEDGSDPSTVGSKLRSTLASMLSKAKNRGARAAGGSSEDWVSLASGKNDFCRKNRRFARYAIVRSLQSRVELRC